MIHNSPSVLSQQAASSSETTPELYQLRRGSENKQYLYPFPNHPANINNNYNIQQSYSNLIDFYNIAKEQAHSDNKSSLNLMKNSNYSDSDNGFESPFSNHMTTASISSPLTSPVQLSQYQQDMNSMTNGSSKIATIYQQNINSDISSRKDSTDFSPFMHSTMIVKIDDFKVIECQKKEKHEKKRCPYFHNDEDRRRQPQKYQYSLNLCSQNGKCYLKDECPQAHNKVEQLYHPLRYRTKFCTSQKSQTQAKCEYGIYCSFAHDETEIVIPIIAKLPQDAILFMYFYKTVWCPDTSEHERSTCPYIHNVQDFRRDPILKKTEPNQCENWKTSADTRTYAEGGCLSELNCNYCHGWKELGYHPQNYKTKPCKKENCPQNAECVLYHSDADKRVVTPALLEQEEHVAAEILNQLTNQKKFIYSNGLLGAPFKVFFNQSEQNQNAQNANRNSTQNNNGTTQRYQGTQQNKRLNQNHSNNNNQYDASSNQIHNNNRQYNNGHHNQNQHNYQQQYHRQSRNNFQNTSYSGPSPQQQSQQLHSNMIINQHQMQQQQQQTYNSYMNNNRQLYIPKNQQYQQEQQQQPQQQLNYNKKQKVLKPNSAHGVKKSHSYNNDQTQNHSSYFSPNLQLQQMSSSVPSQNNTNQYFPLTQGFNSYYNPLYMASPPCIQDFTTQIHQKKQLQLSQPVRVLPTTNSSSQSNSLSNFSCDSSDTANNNSISNNTPVVCSFNQLLQEMSPQDIGLISQQQQPSNDSNTQNLITAISRKSSSYVIERDDKLSRKASSATSSSSGASEAHRKNSCSELQKFFEQKKQQQLLQLLLSKNYTEDAIMNFSIDLINSLDFLSDGQKNQLESIITNLQDDQEIQNMCNNYE